MYKIGTLVLYDKRGVYKIESLGPSPVQEASGDYYKLCAVFSNSNEIIYGSGESCLRPLFPRSSPDRLYRLESDPPFAPWFAMPPARTDGCGGAGCPLYWNLPAPWRFRHRVLSAVPPGAGGTVGGMDPQKVCQ